MPTDVARPGDAGATNVARQREGRDSFRHVAGVRWPADPDVNPAQIHLTGTWAIEHLGRQLGS